MRVISLVVVSLLTTQYAVAQNPGGTAGANVAFQFQSQEEMKQFITIIQERQAVETRIAVLEEYLVKERDRRDSINGQLLLKYKIDPAESYQIDPDKLQIVVAPPSTPAAANLPLDQPNKPAPQPKAQTAPR